MKILGKSLAKVYGADRSEEALEVMLQMGQWQALSKGGAQ